MVSKWVIYPTYMSRWNNPLILSIDPNFQPDILVVLNHPPKKKKTLKKNTSVLDIFFFGSIKTKIHRYVAFFPAGKFSPNRIFSIFWSQQLTPQVNTSSPGANRSTPRSMTRALWGLIIEEPFGQQKTVGYGFHYWLVKWASILLMVQKSQTTTWDGAKTL